jgi:hypothetical protein
VLHAGAIAPLSVGHPGRSDRGLEKTIHFGGRFGFLAISSLFHEVVRWHIIPTVNFLD